MKFLLFVGIVIGIYFIVRKLVQHKLTKEFKNTNGYFQALLIKIELDKYGYDTGDFSIDFYGFGSFRSFGSFGSKDTTEGSFFVWDREGRNSDTYIGEIYVCCKSTLSQRESHLRDLNETVAKEGGFYYSIENDFSNVIVESAREEKYETLPEFMLIAAAVMSKQKFEHPKWLNEYPEAKKYVNVMFQ